MTVINKYIERPSDDAKKIEQLQDEFWDWWFEQFKQSAYQPSIFEWILLKMRETKPE